MSEPLSAIVRRNRDEAITKAEQMLRRAEGEQRGLNPAEKAEHEGLLVTVAQMTDRIAELEEQERRSDAAARSRVDTGHTGNQSSAPAVVTSEPLTYRNDSSSPSFFVDVFRAKTEGNPDAWDRLRRNHRELKIETRALGNTGGVGGSGGELAPPAWIVNEFVALARPARPTADLLRHQELPSGVSSINLPKVATGTTTAIQSTQNSALSQTDATTTFVSTGVDTVGGKQVVSQQLLDQSPINLDQVILGDLAADYAKQVDLQALNGSGTSGQISGFLGVSGINNVVYTAASPTAQGLYSKMAQAAATVSNTRFMPIQAWIMTPLRWGWLLASVDSQNRPLFMEGSGGGVNTMGVASRVAAESVVGSMHGLPVILDSQIPLLATGSQDQVIGIRADDLWLYESELRAEALRETYGDSLGVLFRLYGYIGAIPNRQPKSIVTITGTGLAYPPTFP